jgi:hypothetical protein
MADRTAFRPTTGQRFHKKLARTLVERAGGDEAGARYCRVRKSQLSDYGNAAVPAFMPADVIEDLETIVGEPLYTRALARLQGCVLVCLPTAVSSANLHAELGAVAKETGEVVHRVCEALADGDVTAAEVHRLRIRDEIADAQERLAALDALVAEIEALG